MRAGQFSPDTMDLLRVLQVYGVRALLVGSEAVIYHGHVRLTGDLDVFLRPSPSSGGGRAPAVTCTQDLLVPGVIVQFGRPPNRIDLLAAISGVSFEEAWAGRAVERISDTNPQVEVCVIGLRELVKNKQAAGRAKDQDDLEFLTQRQREDPQSHPAH